MEKNVVHGLVAQFCRFDGNPQAFHGLVLTNVFVESFRSKGKNLGFQILGCLFLRQNPFEIRRIA